MHSPFPRCGRCGETLLSGRGPDHASEDDCVLALHRALRATERRITAVLRLLGRPEDPGAAPGEE